MKTASNIDNHLPVNTVYYEDIAAYTFTTEYEVSFQEEVELSSGEAKTIADFAPSGEKEEENETQNKHQTTRASDKEEKRLHHNKTERIRAKSRKHSINELKETILLDDLIPWSADQQWPVVRCKFLLDSSMIVSTSCPAQQNSRTKYTQLHGHTANIHLVIQLCI